MTSAPVPDRLNYQARFQQRWPHLRHPDVRSLAWLLDSPVLLNVDHPRWANLLAQLPEVDASVKNWIHSLDQNPQALLDFLAVHPHTRLGHYAENLLAFYFKWCGELVAHSVQVRAKTTIGEFDYLLTTPEGFEHWEFACKFYLFVEPARELADFVGPNLMDNLNDKSHKIMDVQLALGRHPEAQKYLATPLVAARALLKGWLFYPAVDSISLPEVESAHCRGIWCRLSALQIIEGDQFSILSRLNWLAPARIAPEKSISGTGLVQHLAQQFVTDNRPVLVAKLTEVALEGETVLLETGRIFVVPDDWNLG